MIHVYFLTKFYTTAFLSVLSGEYLWQSSLWRLSVFCKCHFTSCFLATSVQGLFGSWQINTNLFESKLYGCCWPVDLLETSQKYAFLGMLNISNKTWILKVSSWTKCFSLQRMLFRQFVKNSRSIANFRFLCKEELKLAEISK